MRGLAPKGARCRMRRLQYCPDCGIMRDPRGHYVDRPTEEESDAAWCGDACPKCWKGPRYNLERKYNAMQVAVECGDTRPADLDDQPPGRY